MINHIKTMELLKYILISIPMISAMTCGIIFMVVYHRSLSSTENKIRLTLSGYYVLMIALWFLTNISLEHYSGRMYIIPLFFLLIQLVQATFYHFICYLLPLSNQSRFNNVHYSISIVVFIMSAALVYVITNTQGYKEIDLYSFFTQYLYIYSTLSMIYYTCLGWIRLCKFNKISYNAFLSYEKLNWIHLLLLVRTIFIILFALKKYNIIVVDIVMILLIACQHIILTFNILQRNIIDKLIREDRKSIMLTSGHIVSIGSQGTIESNSLNTSHNNFDIQNSSLLSQSDIEDYFITDKPFLNKDFKLDDLVKHFGINRSYISKFINVTFSSNVSQYINQWRIREVEILQSLNNSDNIEDIVIQAGFSNYRHYLRAKQISEHNKQ